MCLFWGPLLVCSPNLKVFSHYFIKSFFTIPSIFFHTGTWVTSMPDFLWNTPCFQSAPYCCRELNSVSRSIFKVSMAHTETLIFLTLGMGKEFITVLLGLPDTNSLEGDRQECLIFFFYWMSSTGRPECDLVCLAINEIFSLPVVLPDFSPRRK